MHRKAIFNQFCLKNDNISTVFLKIIFSIEIESSYEPKEPWKAHSIHSICILVNDGGERVLPKSSPGQKNSLKIVKKYG